MKRFNGLVLALAALSLVPASGCIIVTGVDGWDCNSRVWVDDEEQRVSLNAASLEGVRVRTHNGAVTFRGESAGGDDAYVTYRTRAGTCTAEGAQAALDAVEVFVDQRGDGKAHMGWRWRHPKHRHWSASVSFNIHAPEHCDVDIQTHNGPVEATSFSGTARLKTHNGAITVDSRDGSLAARTHNGPITATYSGDDLSLRTHNGRIKADLSGCAAIDGRLITHNGGISVTVGERASTMVKASTHNGGISCRVPLVESVIEKRKLRGQIGEGEGSLSINTHNGGIRIRG